MVPSSFRKQPKVSLSILTPPSQRWKNSRKIMSKHTTSTTRDLKSLQSQTGRKNLSCSSNTQKSPSRICKPMQNVHEIWNQPMRFPTKNRMPNCTKKVNAIISQWVRNPVTPAGESHLNLKKSLFQYFYNNSTIENHSPLLLFKNIFQANPLDMSRTWSSLYQTLRHSNVTLQQGCHLYAEKNGNIIW